MIGRTHRERTNGKLSTAKTINRRVRNDGRPPDTAKKLLAKSRTTKRRQRKLMKTKSDVQVSHPGFVAHSHSQANDTDSQVSESESNTEVLPTKVQSQIHRNSVQTSRPTSNLTSSGIALVSYRWQGSSCWLDSALELLATAVGQNFAEFLSMASGVSPGDTSGESEEEWEASPLEWGSHLLQPPVPGSQLMVETQPQEISNRAFNVLLNVLSTHFDIIRNKANTDAAKIELLSTSRNSFRKYMEEKAISADQSDGNPTRSCTVGHLGNFISFRLLKRNYSNGWIQFCLTLPIDQRHL